MGYQSLNSFEILILEKFGKVHNSIQKNITPCFYCFSHHKSAFFFLLFILRNKFVLSLLVLALVYILRFWLGNCHTELFVVTLGNELNLFTSILKWTVGTESQLWAVLFGFSVSQVSVSRSIVSFQLVLLRLIPAKTKGIYCFFPWDE